VRSEEGKERGGRTDQQRARKRQASSVEFQSAASGVHMRGEARPWLSVVFRRRWEGKARSSEEGEGERRTNGDDFLSVIGKEGDSVGEDIMLYW
jgi:hypothetical protein